jgi:simple sugar transport system ATP-binding protein
MTGPAAELQDISMSFGTVQVLRGVRLDLPAGQVTALLGANGAGKSTLIKVLAGVHTGYGGTVVVGGAPVRLASPGAARRAGIRTVHQRVSEGVVPGASVAENLLLDRIAAGDLPAVGSLRSLIGPAREVAARLGLELTDAVLRGDIHDLGIADQQLVLLARALDGQARVLVLDEPTSALSSVEAGRLFGVVRRLRDSGVAVLYVSHRLGELDAIADRVVVLRDGVVRSQLTPPIEWRRAVLDMLGDTVAADLVERTERRGDREVLILDGVQVADGDEPLHLALRAGEVTGVVGLLGAGKTELAEGVAGVRPFVAGRLRLDGAPFAPRSPHEALAQQVAFVPEDRAAQSLLPGWSLARTASLPFLRTLSRLGVVDHRAENHRAQQVIERFAVVTQGPDQPVDELSGGNQQRVVVGRWLLDPPRVLVLDEPFRGVDVGARGDLARHLRELAAGGAVVLLLTSDVDEVLEAADRILVLADRRVRLDRYRSEIARDDLVTAMSEVTAA